MSRPTLQEIKQEALYASQDIAISWEMLDTDPIYRSDFEHILKQCAALIPEIEQLYIKLVRGENVLEDGAETMIPEDDREVFLDRLEDELMASYQVLDLWNRYQIIENITALDMQSPG